MWLPQSNGLSLRRAIAAPVTAHDITIEAGGGGFGKANGLAAQADDAREDLQPLRQVFYARLQNGCALC
jgi:hypothetical protein